MDTLVNLAVAQCMFEFAQVGCLLIILMCILQCHRRGGQP